MPDNPWAADLDRLRSDLSLQIESSAADLRGEIARSATDLREEMARSAAELREEIARSAAETRRHFDVVMEHVMSSVQLVAEGVAMVDQKVDRLRGEMEQRFEHVDLVEGGPF